MHDQNDLAMAGAPGDVVQQRPRDATVDDSGLVTAAGNGTATITATSSGRPDNSGRDYNRVWPTIKTSVIMMQSLEGLSLRIDAVRSRVPPRIRGTGPDGSAVRR